jgi:hypothetical protein
MRYSPPETLRLQGKQSASPSGYQKTCTYGQVLYLTHGLIYGFRESHSSANYIQLIGSVGFPRLRGRVAFLQQEVLR